VQPPRNSDGQKRAAQLDTAIRWRNNRAILLNC
jgi:hypothetical protein